MAKNSRQDKSMTEQQLREELELLYRDEFGKTLNPDELDALAEFLVNYGEAIL